VLKKEKDLAALVMGERGEKGNWKAEGKGGKEERAIRCSPVRLNIAAVT